MLENIKSKKILKEIFKQLNYKWKLNLIKYNKKLQNIMIIDLNYYKTVSNRYIIYESTRKGKEYNSYNDNIIFEGEYLDGKRNGKGKEYYIFGNLLFEGEYLNGKRNGRGKEYYENGKLKFDGEYLNGKEWNGKGYDMNKNNLI